MLKKLHIRNFQSHADTELEIAPTVTAIVGLNNHGKSAIFRAFKKIVRNDPEGTTFIRDGEIVCEIAVETDLGTVLRRVRSDGASDANLYKVGDLVFAKFGKTGIPEEVKDALGVSDPQQFGDVEFDLNFQEQLEPLFLVVGTGLSSIRGKVLGKITGVDEVQRAIQFGAAEERRLNREADQQIKEFQATIDTLKLYANVPAQLEAFQEIEEMQAACDALEAPCQQLGKLQTDLEEVVTKAEIALQRQEELSYDFDLDLKEVEQLSRRADVLTELIAIEQRLTLCESFAELDMSEEQAELANFEKSVETLMRLNSEVADVQERLERASRISAEDIPDVTEVEALIREADVLTRLYNELESVTTACREKEQAIEQQIQELETLQKEQHELEDELGVCPTCERPFE